VLQDSDVVIVDAESHRERTRFLGGAADLWTLVRWNGFRPRAKGLDVPVTFDADSDSTAVENAAADSARAALAAAASAASASAAHPPAAPSALPSAAAPAQRPVIGAPVHGTFTLSFAALLSEDRARTLAASITVDGHAARVVPGVSGGVAIYRVVYGPYDTKEDADKAGKRTGLPYWVYEGAP
jgi:cell division septation protein DedD